MRNFDFKFKKIKEGHYHFDIVTPYVRYKYMTDVWYNRMIEIGFWWWRLEFYYQGGKVGSFFAELFHIIDWWVRFVYYLIINKIKHYFKKIFKSNHKEK